MSGDQLGEGFFREIEKKPRTPETPDAIQLDIEQARVALAGSIDQLVERVNPKNIAASAKVTLRERAQTPQGKAIIAAAGGVVTLLIVVRVRRAVANHRAK